MSGTHTGGSQAYEPPRTEPPPAGTGGPGGPDQSLGSLLGEVSRDLSTLMRQELELAKAEFRESATKAGKGAGMFGGAAVAGHFVLLFFSLALMWALGALMPLGWSAVIVAVLWAIIAAVLALRGKKELKEVRGLPTTTETLQDIPPTLKPGERTP